MRGKRHRTVSCEKTEASKMPFNQKDRRYHGMARTIADVKDNLKDRAATIVPPTTTRPARQRQPPLRLQPDPKMKTGSYSPAQCTQQCLIQLPDLDLVSEQVRGQINHLHNSSKDTTDYAGNSFVQYWSLTIMVNGKNVRRLLYSKSLRKEELNYRVAVLRERRTALNRNHMTFEARYISANSGRGADFGRVSVISTSCLLQ
ncbi:hypothetical protein RB195_024014 [Necator americanus]|uniref:Uncharacterized protein n=1 Tax=Necator americanus TaxID=51031 RepID=A0ABR1ENQ6_NECAM